MNKYVEPVINLQITVPHIVLPSGSQYQQHVEDVAAGDQQRYTEQVRILPLETLSSRHDEHTGEVLPLTMGKGRYGIFQIKDISAQGRALLLQILRIYPAARQQGRSGSSREIIQIEQLRLSDALAFTVGFRRSSDASEVSEAEHEARHDGRPQGPTHPPHTPLAPTNSVVIFLDEEGTPINYSIDGAKS